MKVLAEISLIKPESVLKHKKNSIFREKLKKNFCSVRKMEINEKEGVHCTRCNRQLLRFGLHEKDALALIVMPAAL